jgi:hypothetical protein
MKFDKTIIDKWVEIWNNYDLSKVPKLFLDDERVTYFSSEKQVLTKGIDDLILHHKDFGFKEDGVDTGNKLWLEDTEIEEYDGCVIVKADWLFKRKGETTTQRGPVTFVYVPVKGAYRIVHAHFSNY